MLILGSLGLPKVSATGGTVFTSGGYKYHVFTSSGTLTVSSGGDAQILIVAGGAGGANGYWGSFWDTTNQTAAADRKSTRLNSSHMSESRMPSSA